MVTLSKRANPSQLLILRAVEGAVKNASDAHGWRFKPEVGRSIAKRAAGTLTQLGGVLAGQPSDSAGVPFGQRTEPTASCSVVPIKRGSSHDSRRPPQLLIRELSHQIGPAKRAGELEKANTLIEVLRLIEKIYGGKA